MIEEDPEFFRYVMFSDDAKIYSDGQLNPLTSQGHVLNVTFLPYYLS